ncbi:MAG: hypothetical protein CVV02_15850 [Firmicutes bacterium HGW-Firmicutes-7]|nr:MAG: hypothetical protein CVV02_15850 [Firmicutes bacterium HGW-Firmicutes-7]
MKKQKQLKKIGSFFIAVTMVISIGQGSIAASIFSDTKGHWAEAEIQKGITSGFVKGYTDGTFKPNQPVTRAEFSKMLNMALGVSNTASISLYDVKSSDWYYDEVRKAVAAGYITGYTDSTFKPNNKITRQEAANMISKVLPNYGSSTSLSGMKDSGSIASWARNGVTAVFARGYMKGDAKNMYRPEGALTRAEACAILTRLVEGESIVTTNYIIDDDGDTVSKKIFTKNVTIDEDVDDGEVTLDKVVILGTLTVEGGGEDTVKISDSLINIMSVAKDTGDVRVLLTGTSVVNEASLKYGAIIEQKNLSGEGIKNLRLNGSELDEQEVTLRGNFVNIILEDEAMVEVESGKITTLTVNSGAAASTINLNSGTSITTAVVNGKSDFKGTGKISTMKANANDITYETKPSTITKGSGVSRPPVIGDDTEAPIPTFTPKDGGTGVSPDTTITIKFDEAIYIAGGNKVTNSNIDDIVEIRKGSSTGSEVDYSGTISSDKKTITLTPTQTLDTNTYYYIIILKKSIEDEDENENEKITSKFKTGNQDNSGLKPSFSPANGATNVSVSNTITITFDEAIKLAGGSTVTNSNITNFIELRESSVNGTKKAYTATINSAKKVIVIKPSATLTINKDYYVIVLSGEIQDSEGNKNTKTTTTFRTGSPLAVTPTITTNPTAVTSVANNGTVRVTLTTATSGGSIYYTLNGTTPTAASTLYSGPFDISNNQVGGQTITVRAVTVKSGLTNSAVASKAIVFISSQIATPTIATNPTAVTSVANNGTVRVTLATATSGASVYYTLNGTTPTAASTLYSGPFDISNDQIGGQTITVKAVTVKAGLTNSAVASKEIVFISNQTGTPTISTNPSSVTAVPSNSTVTITLGSSTSGAEIYYTTNGSTPTATSTKYDGAFTVDTSNPDGETVTVKAIAIKAGMTNSTVASKGITFVLNDVGAPSITTSPTNVSSVENTTSVTVTLSTATTGATIYYTTDESTPTTSSTTYSGSFSINAPSIEGGTVTIRAIAKKSGMGDSSIKDKTITFNAQVVEP